MKSHRSAHQTTSGISKHDRWKPLAERDEYAHAPDTSDAIDFNLTDEERRAARDAYDNWVLTRAFEDQ